VTCAYALDDGAYVLGALSPGERSVFERHLAGCADCREAVAALAVLPGLLGRLDGNTASTVDGDATMPAPASLLPRILVAAGTERRRQRRTRRLRIAAAALAAAVVTAVVGVGVHVADLPDSPQFATMEAAPGVQVPIVAELALTPVDGGTRVDMRCSYEEGHEGTWPLRLVVYSRTGSEQQVASWVARAGLNLRFSSMTDLPPEAISHIDVTNPQGRTILTWIPA
jgi:hypothetical protein